MSSGAVRGLLGCVDCCAVFGLPGCVRDCRAVGLCAGLPGCVCAAVYSFRHRSQFLL